MSAFSTVVNACAMVVAVPTALAAAYLALLTLLSRRPSPPAPAGADFRFDIIVPAHNEAEGIGRTVQALLAVDWPRELFRLVVVADNCTDATARLAAAAGANVWERNDPEARGKGHALSWAFSRSVAERWASAIVVVDADSTASSNLLTAFATRLARGECAMQCHYDVLNPLDSWRTRLMTVALACFHVVRSRGREYLGLSCGIRGNGWCVSLPLLERLPFAAYSLAEDVEYGIDLALLADARVAYVDEAAVLGEMVSSSSAAERQRQRWEGGRIGLIGNRVPALLRKAARRGDAICLDLAVDLLVPPLSYVVLASLLAIGLGVLDASVSGTHRLTIALAASSLGCLTLYVARGWAVSGVGWRALADIRQVPGFILHKTVAVLGRKRTGEWIRTDRN